MFAMKKIFITLAMGVSLSLISCGGWKDGDYNDSIDLLEEQIDYDSTLIEQLTGVVGADSEEMTDSAFLEAQKELEEVRLKEQKEKEKLERVMKQAEAEMERELGH